MADAADEEGADTDLDGVFAGKLQDAVDDRIKDTGIRAGTEKQDGKDEHDTCGNDTAQALAHISALRMESALVKRVPKVMTGST